MWWRPSTGLRWLRLSDHGLLKDESGSKVSHWCVNLLYVSNKDKSFIVSDLINVLDLDMFSPKKITATSKNAVRKCNFYWKTLQSLEVYVSFVTMLVFLPIGTRLVYSFIVTLRKMMSLTLSYYTTDCCNVLKTYS